MNGEPFLRLGKDHVGGHDCVILGSGPGTYETFGQLLLLLRYLAARRASRIAAFLGYFLLGRSDKDEGKLEFAMPPFVLDEMMAASNDLLDRVISADLHSPQIVMAGRTGLVTPISFLRRLLKRAINDARSQGRSICLAFPDEGSAKRAEEAVTTTMKELDIALPIVFGAKRRYSGSEVDLLPFFGNTAAITGRTVISIDDEIATGRTNIKTAEALLKKEHGAREVWSTVTHLIACGNASEELAVPSCPIGRLYATDTIPIDRRPELLNLKEQGRLHVFEILEDVAWIAYHHHWDISIREMR